MIDLHLGLRPYGPDAPRPQLMGPLCPVSIQGSPVTLLKFQMAPQTYTLDVLWVQNEGAQICMSE
jgi:hypothetical protein